MALDPSIILGVRPVADPMEQYGRAMTLRGLAQQQQLQALQQQQAELELSQSRVLGDAYAGAIKPDGSVDMQAVMGKLAASGAGRAIPGVAKAALEQQKTLADLQHVQAQTGEVTTRTAGLTQDQAIKAHMQSLQALGTVSSPQELQNWLVGGVRSGALSYRAAAELGNQLQADPTSWQSARQKLLMSGVEPLKQIELGKATPQVIETGQTKITRDMNPMSPTFGKEIASPITMTMTPGEVASNGVAWFNARKPTLQSTDQGVFSVAPYATTGTPVFQGAAGAAPAASTPVIGGGGPGAAFRAPAVPGAPAAAASPPAATPAAPGAPARPLGAKDYYTPEASKLAAVYGGALNDRVQSGQDLMMRIGEARKALDQFKPGMGADQWLNVARAAKMLGAPDAMANRIAGGDIAAMQEFQKLSAQQAMESLKQAMGGSGRITQAEFKVFQANNPNIELDPQAIRKIYDFTTRVYQRDLAEQQGRTKYLQDGGDPTQWQAQWARTLDPTGSGELQIPGQPKPAPQLQKGAVVPIKSASDWASLPKGTQYQAPDGSIRVKQ